MRCPHCFEKTRHGATRCPHCAGEIIYSSVASSMAGQTRVHKLASFAIGWGFVYLILWWIATSFLGGVNHEICFWISIILILFGFFGGTPRKG